jgi:anthranilate synthase
MACVGYVFRCTDVDRNDKSRICRAGSVKVIGRRQIEMYSRLIHTVDHVEGYLREGYAIFTMSPQV